MTSLSHPDSDHAAQAAVEWAARTAYGRLVAYLSSRWLDVAAVEDALSEAFVAALRTWPKSGVPRKPEAWLATAARRRLIDGARQRAVRAAHATDLETLLAPSDPTAMPKSFPDERLALLFVCAHPAIDPGVRTPLMLQTVLGLDAVRIARAFLLPAPTMGQRLVRAKTKIREARIRFSLPETHELPGRLESVLEAIYAAYGTGWDESESSQPQEGGLVQESVWLARALHELLPAEPETAGLLALLLYCDARQPGRHDAHGRFIPLDDQDPRTWKRLQIDEAEGILAEAARRQRPGRFQWLAALQSVHSQRAYGRPVDWDAIVALYEALNAHSPTIGTQVGYVAARERRHGPRQAWECLEQLPADATTSYQPYWVVRAHLLDQLGRPAEGAVARSRALALTSNLSTRAFLTGSSGSDLTPAPRAKDASSRP